MDLLENIGVRCMMINAQIENGKCVKDTTLLIQSLVMWEKGNYLDCED